MTRVIEPAFRTGPPEWREALERAVRSAGLTWQALADIAGVGRATITRWQRGEAMPTLRSASAIADVLMDPGLLELARRLKRRRCASCGHPYVAERERGRCCSAICAMRLRRGSHGRRDVAVAADLERLATYERTIEAFCRDCSDDHCRSADCPIQMAGLSSLPLLRRAEA